MDLGSICEQISAGGVVSIIVIILAMVEITPIRVSPLAWIGRRINADTIKRLENVEHRLDEVDKKLDGHVAQSYRNKIFDAQKKLLAGVVLTQEEFDEIIEACEAYELYCKENKIPNEKCKLAIGFIYHTYKTCQNTRTFANLPQGASI